MSIRTAIDHNPLLTIGLLFALAWTALVGLNVITQMRGLTPGSWVGQHGFGGLMGVIVLGVFLGLVLLTVGALGEPRPAPQEWPPE